MIHGSCLCKRIRYEVDGPIGPISHCHCSMCRKAHGAAFGSYGVVKWSDFRLVAGEDDIQHYESSPGITRTFCRNCGATLQWIRASRPEAFGLAVGTLDDDPVARPDCHIYVEDKAPWFEITDDLPCYPEED